jgi:hypothetical protein
MTRAEIISTARKRTNETSTRLVTDTNLDLEIENAIGDIAILLGTVQGKDTSLTTDGTANGMDLPDLFLDLPLIRVLLDGKRITEITMGNADFLTNNPDGLNHYYLFDKQIFVFPTPEAGLAVTLYSQSRTTALTSDSLEPYIIKEAHPAIVYWLCSFIKQSDGQLNESLAFDKLYDKAVAKCLRVPKSRDGAPAWGLPGNIGDFEQRRRNGRL